MRKNTVAYICLVLYSLFITLALSSCSKSGSDDRVLNPPPPPPGDTTTVVNPPPPVNTKKWMVTTLAGSGIPGNVDGDSINASFNAPTSLALDLQGNLFVSDQMNFAIRKITPDGHVSTYATSAFYIYGISVDKQGNLFDVESAMVQKTSSPNVSSIFAGSNTHDYKDSIGTYARFFEISRIAIDKDDNLYLPDYDRTGYPQIRKIAPDATVTTLPLQDNTGYPDNDGPNHYWLFAITVDQGGTIYKSGNGASLIKKIAPDGNVTVLAGGQGSLDHFGAVSDMVADSLGNLYVADIGGGNIRKVAPDGQITTIAGIGGQGYIDGPGTVAQFNYPSGIAISRTGIIYVADMANNRIRKIEYK